MAGIMEKLNQELETLGKRAQAALDEGRFRIELMRLRRQRDKAAEELGYLVYGRERGKATGQDNVDFLLRHLDELEESIEKVKAQMGAINAEGATVEEEKAAEPPGPAGPAAPAAPPGAPPA